MCTDNALTLVHCASAPPAAVWAAHGMACWCVRGRDSSSGEPSELTNVSDSCP